MVLVLKTKWKMVTGRHLEKWKMDNTIILKRCEWNFEISQNWTVYKANCLIEKISKVKIENEEIKNTVFW